MREYCVRKNEELIRALSRSSEVVEAPPAQSSVAEEQLPSKLVDCYQYCVKYHGDDLAALQSCRSMCDAMWKSGIQVGTEQFSNCFPQGILELGEFEARYRRAGRIGLDDWQIVAHVSFIINKMLEEGRQNKCPDPEEMIVRIVTSKLDEMGIDRYSVRKAHLHGMPKEVRQLIMEIFPNVEEIRRPSIDEIAKYYEASQKRATDIPSGPRAIIPPGYEKYLSENNDQGIPPEPPQRPPPEPPNLSEHPNNERKPEASGNECVEPDYSYIGNVLMGLIINYIIFVSPAAYFAYLAYIKYVTSVYAFALSMFFSALFFATALGLILGVEYANWRARRLRFISSLNAETGCLRVIPPPWFEHIESLFAPFFAAAFINPVVEYIVYKMLKSGPITLNPETVTLYESMVAFFVIIILILILNTLIDWSDWRRRRLLAPPR